jgi:hypothetical protein
MHDYDYEMAFSLLIPTQHFNLGLFHYKSANEFYNKNIPHFLPQVSQNQAHINVGRYSSRSLLEYCEPESYNAFTIQFAIHKQYGFPSSKSPGRQTKYNF